MLPSNYRVFLLGAVAVVGGIGFFFMEKGWLAESLAVVAIACLLGFITLSIARVQRPDETPEQAARRRKQTAGTFDPDP